MTNAELSKRDLAHIWHPCSQMSDYDEIIPIKQAYGAVLRDFDGKEYIDCVSSWWVNILGHSNERIAKAIANQADKLAQVILAGFSHEAIIKLSERLCASLGAPFNKCFYGDNGSAAVEIALKMSYHKNKLQGLEKPLFLNLKNSYHGETIGALSVGDVEIYKLSYGGILINAISTKVPMSFKDNEVSEDEALSDLASILKDYGHKISAFIAEPLIQCAGNMNMPSPSFYKKACEMVKNAGIDVIFDEIAVGFGRTGTMWAFNQIGFVPDFICISKGITGGFMPFSVVLTNDSIYNEFLGDFSRAFLHSHSYTGNALAAAGANAVLDIFEDENIIEKNRSLSAFILAEFASLKNHKKVHNFRQCGMVLAFDLINVPKNSVKNMRFEALKRGLVLRPLENCVYFMPPYVISHKQISYAARQIKQMIDEL